MLFTLAAVIFIAGAQGVVPPPDQDGYAAAAEKRVRNARIAYTYSRLAPVLSEACEQRHPGIVTEFEAAVDWFEQHNAAVIERGRRLYAADNLATDGAGTVIMEAQAARHASTIVGATASRARQICRELVITYELAEF